MTTTSTIARSAETADRKAWEAALASYHQIKAEDDAFTPGFREAWKACRAECEAIPHTTLRPDPHTGRRSPVSTSDRHFLAQARHTVAGVDARTIVFEDIPSLQEHLALCREAVAADERRDCEVRKIRDSFDMDRQDNRAEELGEQIAEAQSVLMAIPSPDLAALRTKLDFVTDDGKEWAGYSEDYTTQLRADIARLLPVGA